MAVLCDLLFGVLIISPWSVDECLTVTLSGNQSAVWVFFSLTDSLKLPNFSGRRKAHVVSGSGLVTVTRQADVLVVDGPPRVPVEERLALFAALPLGVVLAVVTHSSSHKAYNILFLPSDTVTHRSVRRRPCRSGTWPRVRCTHTVCTRSSHFRRPASMVDRCRSPYTSHSSIPPCCAGIRTSRGRRLESSRPVGPGRGRPGQCTWRRDHNRSRNHG